MSEAPTEAPRFRRRDFLKLSVAAVAGYALVKTGLGLIEGAPARGESSLRNLSPKQAAIVNAVAAAMLGPSAARAAEAGEWHPAREFDSLLDRLAEDQRAMAGIALHLFDNWTISVRGFLRMPAEAQATHLEAWRTSSLALRRSTWGLLHAGLASGFSGGDAAWRVMDYPGPCMGSGDYAGRAPGHAAFDWDESVP